MSDVRPNLSLSGVAYPEYSLLSNADIHAGDQSTHVQVLLGGVATGSYEITWGAMTNTYVSKHLYEITWGAMTNTYT